MKLFGTMSDQYSSDFSLGLSQDIWPSQYGIYPTKEDVTPASSFAGWMVCLDDIAKMESLDEGWDGYGGLAIESPAISAARQACDRFMAAGLPSPDVVPKSSGTIAFSWEVNGIEAYLEIGNTRFSGFLCMENYEPALFDGAAFEISPIYFFPLLGDAVGVSTGGYTIADIRIRPEFAYGLAA